MHPNNEDYDNDLEKVKTLGNIETINKRTEIQLRELKLLELIAEMLVHIRYK